MTHSTPSPGRVLPSTFFEPCQCCHKSVFIVYISSSIHDKHKPRVHSFSRSLPYYVQPLPLPVTHISKSKSQFQQQSPNPNLFLSQVSPTPTCPVTAYVPCQSVRTNQHPSIIAHSSFHPWVSDSIPFQCLVPSPLPILRSRPWQDCQKTHGHACQYVSGNRQMNESRAGDQQLESEHDTYMWRAKSSLINPSWRRHLESRFFWLLPSYSSFVALRRPSSPFMGGGGSEEKQRTTNWESRGRRPRLATCTGWSSTFSQDSC